MPEALLASPSVLHGEKVSLRGRLAEDVPILDAELVGDVETYSRAVGSAWRPLALGGASLYGQTETSEHAAPFSVVDRETGELAGAAILWGIDLHNRTAHLGVSLRPSFRSRGYGTDVIRVLCRYGFATLGLHRLALETLADNHPMLAAAERCGFVKEAHHRESSWVNGAFADDVGFGLLATEWRDVRSG